MVFRVRNIYTICAFAAIGGGLFGFDISSMSGVLGTNSYKNYFGNPQGTRQGGITCAMPAGSFVGSLMSSYLGDYYGRKWAIQIGAVIWIIGSIIQAASQNVGMLVVGRIIAGICVGITSSLVPVYQSELAPKEVRGRMVSLQQWAITWGILIQYFIQYGASFYGGGPNDPHQGAPAFRIPWGIQIIPAAILIAGLFFFPESPRWLAGRDRWEEALRVLADVHGNGDLNHPVVLAEYQEIEDVIRFEREEAISSYAELAKPRILKRVILGMSIQMWSQLCGMNVMMYYIVYVMEGAGIKDPLLTASIQYIINVVMTIPAIIWMDKWGRRPTLLLGSFGMMTWLLISGSIQGAFGEHQQDPSSAVTWIMVNKESQAKAVVACSYLFVATFAISWGPVSWTMPAEVFPNKVRAKAASLSTASNWAWNCGLAFAVPPLLRSINWKMYMIFAAFNGAALIHMFLTAPETKGVTLEEMDDVFDSGRPWKSRAHVSRLDNLQKDIAEGNVKVDVGAATGRHTETIQIASKI
ncbi:general substrate transporter [Choiromyces venosus 120613-1]|uniref:General substrate transporter n=1 Tax=Choiromyces venosus 120613-1 TaxID=1336337 RepID=A0A3N4ITB3_9PEZI|nr:general substrate transporter [Choiromyces venosus 120613-1]